MSTKKLTPLQKAIARAKEDKIENIDSDFDRGYNRALINQIAFLKTLLLSEKEFAREFFNDGNELGGLVKFEDSFKQYEQ